MADDGNGEPPAWWVVEGRARRDAHREARRAERAERRDARRGPGSGTPPREPMSPERIADAALGIIDAAGIDGLTVRALAQALGVGTMTLYWYVQNKDEILDLVADRLLATVTRPTPSEDWREAVRQSAATTRAALLLHARAVPILAWRGSFGPNGLQLTEASIAALRTAGFSAEDAADAYFTVSNFVTGFCVFETMGADVLGLDRQSYAQRARQYIAQLPPQRFPNLVAAAPRMFGDSGDDRFAFGLDCLIEGLARRLASNSDPIRPDGVPGGI